MINDQNIQDQYTYQNAVIGLFANSGLRGVIGGADFHLTSFPQSTSTRAGWLNENYINCGAVPMTPKLGLEKIISTAVITIFCTFGGTEGVMAARVTAMPTRTQSIYTASRQENFERLSFAVDKEKNSAGSADQLIAKLQRLSGLTLEFVAPLLGVSRRAIQNWKKGETINLKNEIKLRSLVETIEKLNQGSATKTKNVLLERTPGYLRTYDLLAQGRFSDAISRAEQKEPLKPIRSNPNLKFDHLPLAVQLSRSDDGPFVPTGPRVRQLSRRPKAQS